MFTSQARRAPRSTPKTLSPALSVGGEDGRLGPTRELELAQQARDVVLHRVLREEHRLGDLFVRLAVGDELQDPRFLGREADMDGSAAGGLAIRSTTRATALGSISDTPVATFFTSSIRSRP